jgi:hypothetical protein
MSQSHLIRWYITSALKQCRYIVHESESYVTTDGQSASLSWYKALIRGLRPDFYFRTSDSYVLDSVGRPLWREDGSVFCICCWPLPAQSFSGPSPLGLAIVFYCLRSETSLFVASYDSQGHGGGIRPHELIILLITPRNGLHRKHRFQQLYCCVTAVARAA